MSTSDNAYAMAIKQQRPRVGGIRPQTECRRVRYLAGEGFTMVI